MLRIVAVLGALSWSATSASGFEVGQTVVAIRDAELKVENRAIDRVFPGQPLKICEVNCDLLWVIGDKAGWLESKHVADFDEALPLLNEMIRKEPTNARLYDGRALAHGANKEYELALKDHDEAIRLAPNAAHYTHRGTTYYGTGDYEKAIADYDAALRQDPKYAAAFNGRGTAWLARRKYDRAVADFNEALRLDPTYSDALENRGQFWYRRGDYDKAIVDYDAALLHVPKRATALNHRGEAYHASGQNGLASADFEKAVTFDPRFAVAHFNRAKTTPANAIAELEEAVRLDPQNPAPYDALASIWLSSADAHDRNEQKALEYATKACELSERKVGVYLHTLAAAYAATGNFAVAFQTQDQALDVATVAEASSFSWQLDYMRQHKLPFPAPAPKLARLKRNNLPVVQAKHLKFKVVAVFDEQQPTAHPPFHLDGGEWTFLECEAETDPEVKFTVGLSLNGPFEGWGRAMLAVPDQATGGKFVNLCGKSFSAKVPPPIERAYKPKPFIFDSIPLSRKTPAKPNKFDAATEVSLRWTPEFDGRRSYVRFNFTLDKREGTFLEDDPPADLDELPTILATALRDGPPPDRTPETDSNITRTGPTIGAPRKLLARLPQRYEFTVNGRFAVYGDRGVFTAVPLDVPNGAPFEIARFDRAPFQLRILNDDLELLAQEHEGIRASSLAGSVRIWWISPLDQKKTLLLAPAKALHLAIACASPDRRFVAVFQSGANLNKFLIVFDRESGAEKRIKLPFHSMTLDGWKTTDAGLRAILYSISFRGFGKDRAETYLVDPLTGTLERQDEDQVRAEFPERLSPDGKYRFRLGMEDFTLTEVATGAARRFLFQEDDRRLLNYHCLSWVGPNYLAFSGRQLTLIDAKTLKMYYPQTADGATIAARWYRFSPDFHWVMYQHVAGDGQPGEGLYLAPITMPQ